MPLPGGILPRPVPEAEATALFPALAHSPNPWEPPPPPETHHPAPEPPNAASTSPSSRHLSRFLIAEERLGRAGSREGEFLGQRGASGRRGSQNYQSRDARREGRPGRKASWVMWFAEGSVSGGGGGEKEFSQVLSSHLQGSPVARALWNLLIDTTI